METQDSRLVALLTLIDLLPDLPACAHKRGRPPAYDDRLFVKAIVVMLVRRVTTVNGLLSVLAEETPQMQALRILLTESGRFPSRRTWERRLWSVVPRLPEYIASLGHHLLALIQPWQQSGRAVAVDSTALRACGGVWHTKHREAGIVPHSSIDTEASWSKSGWHGWWYGWKLHVVCTVGPCWIPLAARLTDASQSDGAIGLALLQTLPPEVHLILGDHHYHTKDIQAFCAQTNRLLVCSRGTGKAKADDPGRQVRRILHKLRSTTVENWNEHFKNLFEGHSQVPTKGKIATQRFILGAVLVYQLILWYRFLHAQDLRRGLKPFLKAC